MKLGGGGDKTRAAGAKFPKVFGACSSKKFSISRLSKRFLHFQVGLLIIYKPYIHMFVPVRNLNNYRTPIFHFRFGVLPPVLWGGDSSPAVSSMATPLYLGRVEWTHFVIDFLKRKYDSFFINAILIVLIVRPVKR